MWSTGQEVVGFTYSSVVQEYVQDLKERYSKLPVLRQNERHAYNLVIRQDCINRALDKRAIFQSPAYAHLQHLLTTVDPITCASIFDCDTTTECILLEGEECVGKTQLVQDLCQKWEQIPSLRRFQLIILLDLKNEEVQKIEGPHGLFHHHDLNIQQELVRLVCDAKGKDVLIIIDGFEQLASVLSTENDDVKSHSYVIKIIEGKVFPKSMKLITLTPLAFRHIISAYDLTNIRHIQLLGLHREHLKHMPSPSCQQISFRTQSLMYLPMNASTIAKVYHKCVASHHSIPLTLTQYYKWHCLDLIRNYFSPDPSSMHPLQLFDDLQLNPDVQEKIMQLSKTALVQTIQKNDSLYDLGENFVHFGLMDSSSHNKGQLSFLNRILQAFLAAYFISQLDDYEKDQIFFSHSPTEMCNVWKFVAGLNGLTCTILDTLKSNTDDLYYLPFIVSLLYEQQDASIVKYVFQDSIITYCLCYPEESQDTMYKCYSLGYCIATSNSVWRLNFSSCNVKVEDLKALVHGITSAPTACGCIGMLQLDNNVMTQEKMEILSELPGAILNQITSMKLNSCHLTPEGLSSFSTKIIPTLPNLEALDIGNNPLKHCNMSKVFSSLANLPRLQELCLENTTLEFEDMVPLNKLLSMTESTVIQLSIGGHDMPAESMNLLIDTVLTQSSVESLRISDLDLTRNVDTIVLLETNTKLTRLVFFECQLDLAYLATSLCMNTALKELEIFFPLSNAKNDIDSQAAVAFSDMLEVNRSLNDISLYSYKPIVRRKVLSLVETLKYNYSLEILQLPDHYSENFTSSELNVLDPRVYWRTWPCITCEV